jgi:hypothetical protein
LEIEGSADPLADLDALRRAKLNERSPVQEWNAAANLFPSATNAAATQGPPARTPRKVVSFDKGAFALRSQVAFTSRFETKSRTSESSFPRGSARAFADGKGATALMMILAPQGAATDLDWDAQLLESVEIAPEALGTLAVERARNVRAYLLQTGKVESGRITESAGTDSKGSRVYVRLR